MKIIIIGAGQVGGTLAENLVGERNEITIIDTNSETLHELQDKMDLQVVIGHGSHPDVLKQAGAEDAELVIAVTSDDATNMCFALLIMVFLPRVSLSAQILWAGPFRDPAFPVPKPSSRDRASH